MSKFMVVCVCVVFVAWAALTYYAITMPPQDPIMCKGGYLFVRSSGAQLIGTNGGGVKCGENK